MIREEEPRVKPVDLLTSREFTVNGADVFLFGETHAPPKITKAYSHLTKTGRPVFVENGAYDVDLFILTLIRKYKERGKRLTVLLEAPYHYRGSSGSRRDFLYKRSPVLHLDQLLAACYDPETCPFAPEIKVKFVDLRSCDVGSREKALDPLLQLVVVLTDRPRRGKKTVLETFALVREVQPLFIPYLSGLIRGRYKPILDDLPFLFQKVPIDLVKKGRHKIARKIGASPYKRQILEYTDYLIHLVDQEIRQILGQVSASVPVQTLLSLLDSLVDWIGELTCLPINGYVSSLILQAETDLVVLMGADHIEKIAYLLGRLAEE